MNHLFTLPQQPLQPVAVSPEPSAFLVYMGVALILLTNFFTIRKTVKWVSARKIPPAPA